MAQCLTLILQRNSVALFLITGLVFTFYLRYQLEWLFSPEFYKCGTSTVAKEHKMLNITIADLIAIIY